MPARWPGSSRRRRRWSRRGSVSTVPLKRAWAAKVPDRNAITTYQEICSSRASLLQFNAAEVGMSPTGLLRGAP